MNKKLLSLAVAAAVAAPTAAMAEAILYGKIHASIDYQDVTNAIAPTYDTLDSVVYSGQSTAIGTATNVWDGNPLVTPGASVVGTFENVDSFVNTTDSSVFVDVRNDDGSLAEVVEVAPGELFSGVTASFDTGELEGEEVTFIRTDGAGNPIVNGDGQDFTGWGISREGGFMQGSSRASRLGVKGSEDLGNGLKAIYQVELGLNLTAADDDIDSGNNGISYRNSFAGIAGGFGTVLAGRHDTPLKISTGKLDMFADTMADYNGTVGFDDVRADNVVAYISPSFSGFSFMGAIVAPGGATVTSGLNVENDSLASAYSLALIYNNGPFFGSAAYELLGKEHFMDSDTNLAGKEACVSSDGTPTLGCGYIEDDYSKWRLGLGLLDWNGFSLTAIYENQDDLPAGQTRDAVGFVDPNGNVEFSSLPGGYKEQQLWQVQAGYAFGNNMVKAMYGAVDRDTDDRRIFGSTRDTLSIENIRDDLGGDRSTWAIAFDHNFSKRTKAYALYVNVDDDSSDIPGGEPDWSGFSLGLVHKF